MNRRPPSTTFEAYVQEQSVRLDFGQLADGTWRQVWLMHKEIAALAQRKWIAEDVVLQDCGRIIACSEQSLRVYHYCGERPPWDFEAKADLWEVRLDVLRLARALVQLRAVTGLRVQRLGARPNYEAREAAHTWTLRRDSFDGRRQALRPEPPGVARHVASLADQWQRARLAGSLAGFMRKLSREQWHALTERLRHMLADGGQLFGTDGDEEINFRCWGMFGGIIRRGDSFSIHT